MSRRIAIVVATILVAASCSESPETSPSTAPAATTSTTARVTATEPSTSITTTTESTPTTTSTTSSTSATTGSQASYLPPDPFIPPAPTSTGGGSGCSPGPGSLPDGVWFGYVTLMKPNELTFDLACYRTCVYGDGFRITNDQSTERIVPAAPDARAVSMYRSPDEWLEAYAEFRVWYESDPDGLLTYPLPAWIYVNDGAMTHLVWYTELAQCRADAVEVEWIAELPKAGLVGFNDLGLATSATWEEAENRFYWFDDFASISALSGEANSGWEGSDIAADGRIVGIGSDIHEWTGSGWETWTFDDLDDSVWSLAADNGRVLLASESEDRSRVHVVTRTGSGWDVETILDTETREWRTIAGAIHGDTLAVSDTGIDSQLDAGTALIFTWNGSTWAKSATLVNPRGWEGNWGSSLSLDGDSLVVGADGYTPGPGSSGGVYLYTRVGDRWVPEVIAEGSEGFGTDATIDGTIVVGGDHGIESTLWVFTEQPDGWAGTAIAIPGEVQWIWGIDLLGDLVAISTGEAVHIGRIVRRP